jgi:hypothetical protein
MRWTHRPTIADGVLGVGAFLVTFLGGSTLLLTVLAWSRENYLGDCLAWPLVLPCLVGLILADRIIARRVRRRHARSCSVLCAKCGCNLTGNTAGRCPECGAPISP